MQRAPALHPGDDNTTITGANVNAMHAMSAIPGMHDTNGKATDSKFQNAGWKYLAGLYKLNSG
jgi:hypothetical protein